MGQRVSRGVKLERVAMVVRRRSRRGQPSLAYHGFARRGDK